MATTTGIVLKQVGKAVHELDRVSFSHRTDADARDMRAARELLVDVLQRNGYWFSEPGRPRIRRMRADDLSTREIGKVRVVDTVTDALGVTKGAK